MRTWTYLGRGVRWGLAALPPCPEPTAVALGGGYFGKERPQTCRYVVYSFSEPSLGW